MELKSALYESDRQPLLNNHIFGLGGRDIDVTEIEDVFKDLIKVAKNNKVERLVNYLGVR